MEKKPENVFEKGMVTKKIWSSFLPGHTHTKPGIKIIGRIEV